jgi:hypothetical protein
MPEPNTELIVPVLINGATFAAVAVIVPAFLLSRFTRDIIGRSVLVIFLVIAAGAYFGFALTGRELVGTDQIWMLVELIQAVVFGAIALLGLRAPRIGLLQDGRCTPSGTSCSTTWDRDTHSLLGPTRSRVSASIGWLPSISSSPMDWLGAAGWDSERSLLVS